MIVRILSPSDAPELYFAACNICGWFAAQPDSYVLDRWFPGSDEVSNLANL